MNPVVILTSGSALSRCSCIHLAPRIWGPRVAVIILVHFFQILCAWEM